MSSTGADRATRSNQHSNEAIHGAQAPDNVSSDALHPAPRGLAALLGAMVMVGPLGIDTYLPSLPTLAATYAAPAAVVQQTLSVFVFTMAVTMLFYGTLSDSLGRRPVLLFSLGLFTVANLAAVFAPTIGVLIACRALQGVAAGAGAVIARAVIQDCYRGADAQRAMAQVLMVFGLAPAIAPIIGGWLHHAFGWQSIFVFLTAGGAVLFALCYLLLGETLPRSKFQPLELRPIVGNYLSALRDLRFVVMCLSIGLLFTGIPLYIGAAAPFLMDILHQPETAFGWLFIPVISGVVIGSATAERMLKRNPTVSGSLIRWGMAICIVAAAINILYTASHTAAIPYAVMPLALYTFGVSLAMPGMVVRALNRFPTMHGLSSSMQGFIQMMLFTVVSGLVSPLLFDSALKLAVGMSIGIVMGIALWTIQSVSSRISSHRAHPTP
jgi:DHA1 family bicyclomycin/chloramphenicol resistance-like MFS transporter